MKKRKRRSNGTDVSAGSSSPDTSGDKGAAQLPLPYVALWSFVSAAVLYLAFPPLGWSLLAWVAPAGWLWLVQSRWQLTGRAYWIIWGSGVAFWLVTLQGVRLAHPALYLGWFALSAYLAVYIPLFVGLTRVAVWRLQWPLVLAAPTVWVGLELIRGYLLTGFSLGLLGHAVVTWTPIIQIADLFGAYGVSFLLMAAAAAVVQLIPQPDRRPNPTAAAVFGVLLALTFVYGQLRLGQTAPGAERPPLNVALVQGSVDTVFEYNPERDAQAFYDYREKTLRAAAENPQLDLIVWPESIFTAIGSDYVLREPLDVPPEADMTEEAFRRAIEPRIEFFAEQTRMLAQQANAAARSRGGPSRGDLTSRGTLSGSEPFETEAGEAIAPDITLLLGSDTVLFGPHLPHRYNSALMVQPDGDVTDRYYKMHPVMFGEYIPLGSLLPWIYRLTPMSGGLTAGTEPSVFSVGQAKLSPSICFESTVPHLIRRHVFELGRQGQEPDFLVNLTNDGWFWGSSILDLHFACAIFRAVEHRRPMLIAANTGITAVVDGNGHIQHRVPRRTWQTLVAAVSADGRWSFYTRFGDVGALACLLALLVFACVGLRKAKQ